MFWFAIVDWWIIDTVTNGNLFLSDTCESCDKSLPTLMYDVMADTTGRSGYKPGGGEGMLNKPFL